MGAQLVIENGKLRGDLDAAGYQILNLNLEGLNLTKYSVGLGNVDNTSDANKPISSATLTALNLKENFIGAGTTGQFWRGDKTWVDYGDFALQDAVTTFPLVSVIGSSPSTSAILQATRSDYGSSSAATQIVQTGSASLGTSLLGIPIANNGMLTFQNCSFGIIKTSNSAPIYFGTNGFRRARLQLGLLVGAGDTDPGAGCIRALNTITASEFVGGGAGITGITKDQIPGTLNATVMQRLKLNGVGGEGLIEFFAQSSAPVTAFAAIYGDAAGKISLFSGSSGFPLKFDSQLLTAARAFILPNAAGTLPVRVSVPSTSSDAGQLHQIAWDASYLYLTTALNTWKRIALSSF